jgi:hypothetical protein
MTRRPPRDEREARIDLAADRLAYLVVSYGLLLAVAYRSFVHADAWFSWLGPAGRTVPADGGRSVNESAVGTFRERYELLEPAAEGRA